MKTIELFLFGFAAVVDLALLLALWERVNRGRVAIWLTILVASAALIHVAIFTRLMIGDAAGEPFVALDRALVAAICVGLLMLPSAMLHAAIRLNHTGIDAYPPADQRYRWLYIPLLLFPWIGYRIWNSPAIDFITHVAPWRTAYLVWLVVLNTVSTYLFLRLRKQKLTPQSETFLLHLAFVVITMTFLAVVYGTIAIGTDLEAPLRLLAIMSPLAAAMLFVWHSMRGRLLPVVMERTFLYAVGLISLLLVHRLLLTPIFASLRAKTKIDFFFIEGILIAAVIFAVPSLRNRVAESLRQLFSTNVVQVRNAIRQVALKLSQNASRDTTDLMRWFADELRRSIALDYVTIVLDDDAKTDKETIIRSDESVAEATTCCASADLYIIHQALDDQQRVLELGAIADNAVEQSFVKEKALLAYRMSYRTVTGTVVLGNRIRNDRLAREQVYVLSIVIDQFAATMHNRREELLRQQAERKILQQEKLSVLGLLSGSLAHELRNPLSSIRTITTLVMEDLGKSHESRRELQMVVDEIDRLSQTTNRLLDYSRPEPQTQARIDPHRVISRIVCVLDYLAKQYHVETKLRLAQCDIRLESNDAALSEIVFNLVKNAIEAASEAGTEAESGFIEISTKCEDDTFVFSVCDNGCGISSERQSNLFQPFATYKVDGNGLGLYAVNERVRELGGNVSFGPCEPCGTVFEVRLPIASKDDHSGC